MDSDDDFMYDEDEPSEPEDDQDDDFVGFQEPEGEPSAKRAMREQDDFQFDCLTPESIVSAMKRSIDEVNSVFQVGSGVCILILNREVDFKNTYHRESYCDFQMIMYPMRDVMC